MAVAVDSEMPTNTGDGAGTAGGSPLTPNPRTFSFTNTAGTLLVAIIGNGVGSASTVTLASSVTYGGSALTKLVEKSTGAGTGGKLAIYYLLAPLTGANTFSYAWTNNLAPTNNEEAWAGLTSFTGHDLVSPFPQNTSANGTGTTASAALAGVTAGSVTICGAGAGSSMSAQSQTLTWLANVDGGTSMGNGRASRSASSGSVTHNFTISASDSWAAVIAEIAAPGTAVPAQPLRPTVPFMSSGRI